MVKKRTHDESKMPRSEKKYSPDAADEPLRQERQTISTNLIELRPGLFLNEHHIVSVRVLPAEEAGAYAILQLSSGEKLNLTRDEYKWITGATVRSDVRSLQAQWAQNVAE